MSKQILVTVPDNFFTENVIKRIEMALGPKVLAVEADKAGSKVGDTLLLIAEFQNKLKQLT